MNRIIFSHGLQPWSEVITFIETYFQMRGIPVAAAPSYNIDEPMVPDFPCEAAFIEDCHDKLIDFLFERDFSVQPAIERPDVKTLERKSNLVMPNDEDLKRDYSKLPEGVEAVLGWKRRKHYKFS